jgi:fucose 4-O-acetylase-like acetyltransferase
VLPIQSSQFEYAATKNDLPDLDAQMAKMEPIPSGTRSNLVDIVKGLAIILVTFGHTAQGMTHRGWWTTPGAAFSRAFIYSFHMPSFFFVAGLFVHGSITRRGALPFTLEKIKSVLYPYLLFAVTGLAIQPLVGRFEVGVTPFRWQTVLLKVADGDASWFLFALFFCLMLALLTIHLPDGLRFVAAFAVGGVTTPFGPPLTNQVLREFCFLAAGMWVGARIHRLEKIRSGPAAVGFILLAAFQTAAIYLFGPATRWSYIGLGLTGTSGLFLLAKLLDRHRLGGSLASIGRASLAIFLLSAFAQGATRVMLSDVFHTQEFWLQLLLPTALATLLSAIVWHQQRRWRLSWLFYWPW